jgi:hypothetical protein
MDRRTLLLSLGAVALPLPALAAKTSMVWMPPPATHIAHRLTVGREIIRKWDVIWFGGAHENPHAELVRAWIKEAADAGILYCSGDTYMERTVRLEDTTFAVRARGKVWNYLTGYTDEDGLEITITEGAAKFAPIGILDTEGNTLGIPNRYYVRKPVVRYEEDRELRFALGDDPLGYHSKTTKLGYDMRWLHDAVPALKAPV